MTFILKNKRAINVVLIISIVLDVLIGFIVNKISGEAFSIKSAHNIILLLFLIMAVAALICCKLIEFNVSTTARNKKLQKAFQENGGYETIVDEMKSCIKRHDLRTLKDLKRMVDIIEK